MAKKNRYADWLQANQTVPGSYAELMARNEQIKNTPETVVTGYSAVPKMAQSFGAADNTDVAPTEKYDPAYADWLSKYGTKAFTQKEYDAANGIVRDPTAYDELKGVVRDREKWNEQNGVIGTYVDYAKRLGVAEQKQQADAAYDRAIPTYGAQAEQLAQAGIHGGYGEYLASQAYATMQNQKYAIDKAARESYADYARENDQEYARQMQEATTAFKQHQHEADAGYAAYLAKIKESNDAAYQEYTVAQEAQAKADKQARDARVGSLYTRLAKASYNDANGESVQGYGLESVTNDDKYAAAKEQYRQELVNMGATEDEVDEALARVDKQREIVVAQKRADAEAAVKGASDDSVSNAQIFDALGYTPQDGEEEGTEFLRALNQGVEQGLISPETRSTALKDSLDIYGNDNNYGNKSFDDRSWETKGKNLYESVSTAIDYGKEGLMSKDDVDTVINDATKKLGINNLWYNTNYTKRVTITLSNGKGIWADYDDAASDEASEFLANNYGNLPMAMYDGELYYQAVESGYITAGNENLVTGHKAGMKWYRLKTKKGTPGSPEDGDNYFKTIALIMMQNKDKYGQTLAIAPKKGTLVVSTPRGGEKHIYTNNTNFPAEVAWVGYNIKTGKITYQDADENTLIWENRK